MGGGGEDKEEEEVEEEVEEDVGVVLLFCRLKGGSYVNMGQLHLVGVEDANNCNGNKLVEGSENKRETTASLAGALALGDLFELSRSHPPSISHPLNRIS
jgi:hypothetical protein